MFGYGHEEWLFRFEWAIDGWQYGFLQGANKKDSARIKCPGPADVILFTCEPGNRRKYIARIADLEFLDLSQSQAVYSVFERKGWLERMKAEIRDVGGNLGAFDDKEWTDTPFNVRFRVDNVLRYPEDAYAEDVDYVLKLKRYQLNLIREGDKVSISGDSVNDIPADVSAGVMRGRVGREHAFVINPYMRAATPAREVTPEHGKMQAKLREELRNEYPDAKISCEENYIDILVRSETERILFEIKCDLDPVRVLRLAIGQLLEYAFYRPSSDRHRVRLVAVGRSPLSSSGQAYLECLRNRFNLPLEYRVVEI